MAVSIALLKLELLLMRHIYWKLDPDSINPPFLKQANSVKQLKQLVL